LRRVRKGGWRSRIYEVYYDDEGLPFGYCAVDWVTRVRFWWEAFRAPVLRYPQDFRGRPPTDEKPRT